LIEQRDNQSDKEKIAMADNYLEFSETLGPLNKKQEVWLDAQLSSIVVVNGKEFPADKAPDCDEPDYRGLRFLRDYDDSDNDFESVGFSVSYEGFGKNRCVWIYGDEQGDPRRVAHLVQKFLKKFRPNQCWSLTYATTCSKPRVGEFGGGAVFVTANTIVWQDAYEFVEQQRAAFKQNRKPHPGKAEHGETAAIEP